MELSLFVLEASIKLLDRERRISCSFRSPTGCSTSMRLRNPRRSASTARSTPASAGSPSWRHLMALTADHGMNDKSDAEDKPNVIWLQDILDDKFGKGDTRVICPITDAFVGLRRAGRLCACTARGGRSRAGDLGDRPYRRYRAGALARGCVPSSTTYRPTARATWRSSRADVCIGGARKEHDLAGLEGPPPAHARRRLRPRCRSSSTSRSTTSTGCAPRAGRSRATRFSITP